VDTFNLIFLIEFLGVCCRISQLADAGTFHIGKRKKNPKAPKEKKKEMKRGEEMADAIFTPWFQS